MEAVLAALRAAAESTRLRLLLLLSRGELTVGDLTQILGQSQPRVSRHLKLLCEAGLLDRFREGNRVFYRLADHGSGREVARRLVELVPGHDALVVLDAERFAALTAARAEAAHAYFRRNAAQWDRIRSLYVDDREVERALCDLLPPGLGPGAARDLLDIGTGTGRMLELFAPRVERAVGIDLSREMLAVARVNLERARLGNCSVRQGDMYQLPLPGGSFDAVLLHQVLHYAERPAAVLAEAARVLRPGGRLIVIDFAPHEMEELRAEHEHRRLGFADGEVAGWLRVAGLEAGEVRHLPGSPLTVSIWPAYRPPAGAEPFHAEMTAAGGIGTAAAAATAAVSASATPPGL
ncbi:MAG TPA: metalloregulator ArsR/SmtB family transcription factor [Stellaceae bacterium]